MNEIIYIAPKMAYIELGARTSLLQGSGYDMSRPNFINNNDQLENFGAGDEIF